MKICILLLCNILLFLPYNLLRVFSTQRDIGQVICALLARTNIPKKKRIYIYIYIFLVEIMLRSYFLSSSLCISQDRQRKISVKTLRCCSKVLLVLKAPIFLAFAILGTDLFVEHQQSHFYDVQNF